MKPCDQVGLFGGFVRAKDKRSTLSLGLTALRVVTCFVCALLLDVEMLLESLSSLVFDLVTCSELVNVVEQSL